MNCYKNMKSVHKSRDLKRKIDGTYSFPFVMTGKCKEIELHKTQINSSVILEKLEPILEIFKKICWYFSLLTLSLCYDDANCWSFFSRSLMNEKATRWIKWGTMRDGHRTFLLSIKIYPLARTLVPEKTACPSKPPFERMSIKSLLWIPTSAPHHSTIIDKVTWSLPGEQVPLRRSIIRNPRVHLNGSITHSPTTTNNN